VTTRIEVVIEPFQAIRDLIVTIPGISTLVADVIIAETGADMTRFPTAAHLASWAGTCPGSNESAGRVKSTHTRPGTPTSRRPRHRGDVRRPQQGHLPVRQVPAHRLPPRTTQSPRRGRTRHPHRHLAMTTTGALYDDPGSDFYTRRNPDKTKQRAIDQLHKLGYTVTIEPHQAAMGT
jgi:transposase